MPDYFLAESSNLHRATNIIYAHKFSHKGHMIPAVCTHTYTDTHPATHQMLQFVRTWWFERQFPHRLSFFLFH